MNMEDVEHEILLGLADGERPADVLYMCYAVVASRLAHGDDSRDDFYIYFFEERFARRGVRLLFNAGLLLCPIFEPVKHEEYQEYTSSMKSTRLSYTGIATDPRLKFEFGEAVERGVKSGAFQSLKAANENRLWEILRRGRDVQRD